MSKEIRLKKTLFYYDMPQIILGEDQVGSLYLCLLVDDSLEDHLDYLCIPISKNYLYRLENGDIDLRDVFKHPEISEYYRCHFADFHDPAPLEPMKEQIPTHWLPEKGFLFPPPIPTENVVITRARQANKLVLHLHLFSPEAAENKILVDSLSEFLFNFQRFIKYAYKRVSKRFAKDIEKISFDPYRLFATCFLPGSFIIECEPLEEETDLYGKTLFAESLELFDRLVERIPNPEQSLLALKKYQGHLASSYINLLTVLNKNQSSLGYEWACPSFSHPSSHRLDKNQLPRLLKVLTSTQELGQELVELIGTVVAADDETRTWKIINREDGKEHSGKIKPDSEITFAGLTLRTVEYRFICEETTERIAGLSKEKTTLHLIEYKPIETNFHRSETIV